MLLAFSWSPAPPLPHDSSNNPKEAAHQTLLAELLSKLLRFESQRDVHSNCVGLAAQTKAVPGVSALFVGLDGLGASGRAPTLACGGAEVTPRHKTDVERQGDPTQPIC